jgi:hypothetical protein
MEINVLYAVHLLGACGKKFRKGSCSEGYELRGTKLE